MARKNQGGFSLAKIIALHLIVLAVLAIAAPRAVRSAAVTIVYGAIVPVTSGHGIAFQVLDDTMDTTWYDVGGTAVAELDTDMDALSLGALSVATGCSLSLAGLTADLALAPTGGCVIWYDTTNDQLKARGPTGDTTVVKDLSP